MNTANVPQEMRPPMYLKDIPQPVEEVVKVGAQAGTRFELGYLPGQDLEKIRKAEAALADDILKALTASPLYSALSPGIRNKLQETFKGGGEDQVYLLREEKDVNDVLALLSDTMKSTSREKQPDVCKMLFRKYAKLSRRAGKIPANLRLRSKVIVDVMPGVYFKGGYGDIYKGRYEGKVVALKQLNVFIQAKRAEKAEAYEDFYREVTIWSYISEQRAQYLLPFYGVAEPPHGSQGGPYLVAPWMDKGNIRDHIDGLIMTAIAEHLDSEEYTRADKAGKYMLEEEWKNEALQSCEMVSKLNNWLYQIACGLRSLHEYDIVHGDLRGVNILIDAADDVCIADFGIGLIAHVGSSITRDSGSVGRGVTDWLAPELLNNVASARSTLEGDVYAFGCVCIELRSGSDNLFPQPIPKDGSKNKRLNIAQVTWKVLSGERPKMPKGLEASLENVIKQCFETDHKTRPSAADLVKHLESIIGMKGAS